MTGPLDGVAVLELGGIGPGPFATMLLADMGADVVRVDRPGGHGQLPGDPAANVLHRGKRTVELDLKRGDAVDAVLGMVGDTDILVEGNRPGVTERLGLGPDICLRHNPRLVYARMTGWGQDGPLAQTAGHDLTYIALTGALHAMGDADGPPQIPLNLVGDYAGGSMYLVAGVLAALHEATRTGRGQVVDAAIVDGTAHLLAGTHALANAGMWHDERGVNLLDGGAPFYAVYRTADDRFMAVGAIEPQFYALLVAGLGLDEDLAAQNDPAAWPGLRERIAAVFRTRTRTEWTEAFAGTDACVAPVLSLTEAADHPHLRHRGTIRDDGGILQPGTAPRFSRHTPWPAAPAVPNRSTGTR